MHTFSWDFIYAEYVMAAGYHHQSIVWQIAEDYSHCEFLIRLPGYCPMPAFRDMIDVPLVVLRLHKSRKEVRSEMGISEDVKLVILNFGGQPAGWKLKEDYLPRGWLCLHLEELGTDQWPVLLGNRSLRCTGVALSVAAGLLAACVSGTGGRIVALVCGPCTEGHGSIVSQDLSDPVRSHKDIDKDAAVYFRKVVQFYEDLSKQMVSQVGVAEMKVLIERIGGLVVLSESFGHSVFRDSFRRVFESGEDSLGLSYNGTLEMNCSKDIKIQGIIGPCTSLEKKGPSVASTIIGAGEHHDFEVVWT